MKGLARIAVERKRQIEQEGWTPEHDAGHTNGELAKAAAAYCLPEMDADLIFPDVTWNKRQGFPMPTIRDLVKAGVLIAAEIDRRLAAGEEVPRG